MEKEARSESARKAAATRKRNRKLAEERERRNQKLAERNERRNRKLARERQKLDEEKERFRERTVAPFMKEIEKRPDDPYHRLELGRALSKINGDIARIGALDAYEYAFALSIPNARALGVARWEYAALLLNPPRTFDNLVSLSTKHRKAAISDLPEVAHQLREGVDALKRHLRHNSDDVEVLELLVTMSSILGRDTAAWEDKLRVAEKRAGISGGHIATAKTTVDRTGLAFEERCLAVVRNLGFTAVTTAATADGGIDIMARSDGPLLRGRVAVQCKDWQNPVGEPVLRDLLGVVAAEDALKGVLITSSTFTPSALRFADGKRSELIDGEELASLEQTVEPA